MSRPLADPPRSDNHSRAGGADHQHRALGTKHFVIEIDPDHGIAAKASDVDMVYITGYGFPMHRGGPMLYADQFGLFNVVNTMRRFAQNPLDDANFWTPAPLLARLAAEGKTFNNVL